MLSSMRACKRRHAEELPDSLHQALLKMNAPEAIRSQVDVQEYDSAEALLDSWRRRRGLHGAAPVALRPRARVGDHALSSSAKFTPDLTVKIDSRIAHS